MRFKTIFFNENDVLFSNDTGICYINMYIYITNMAIATHFKLLC